MRIWTSVAAKCFVLRSIDLTCLAILAPVPIDDTLRLRNIAALINRQNSPSRRENAMASLPDFDTPRLVDAIEALPSDQLDLLPFGAIKLDPQGVVVAYNAAEAQQSGRSGKPTVGKLFFVDVAPCMDNGYFKGRIDKAVKAGTLDLSFTFVGDFTDRDRELSVRVQAAKDGGMWIFHRRPANG